MKFIIFLIVIIIGFELLAYKAKSQTVPPDPVEECWSEADSLMRIAGAYITKEATANRKIDSLKEIIQDKDEEIIELNRKLHHATIRGNQ